MVWIWREDQCMQRIRKRALTRALSELDGGEQKKRRELVEHEDEGKKRRWVGSLVGCPVDSLIA